MESVREYLFPRLVPYMPVWGLTIMCMVGSSFLIHHTHQRNQFSADIANCVAEMDMTCLDRLNRAYERSNLFYPNRPSQMEEARREISLRTSPKYSPREILSP
tara:strand:- start:183 stop:491 length:309 start_codon:yes stop_codon:yes gene_type:complete